MKRLTLFRWVAVLTLAIALAPSAASAQEDDTLTISGTFKMSDISGTVGADLASVQPSTERWWKLTLNGVSYSHDYSFWEEGFGGEGFITRVHATSFTFEFFGPDAAILNEVVSSQLTRGGVADGAFLELLNEYWVDSDGWFHSQGFWAVDLYPSDPMTSVRFETFDYVSPELPADEFGYPLVQPQRLSTEAYSAIVDRRPGNDGALRSAYVDIVEIGSSEPTPPPSVPTLAIQDGTVLEGKRGTTNLNLNVTLSASSTSTVTVNYATANGTAIASSDYNSASGTLTFQPGQTSKTISIGVKGDRKREPDETFTVQLSNAVGATIEDGSATVTIRNDD